MLGWPVLSAPAFFACLFIQLDPASEAALTSLFFATFAGAYFYGTVVATLEHRDRADDGSTEPMRRSASERPDSGARRN